MTADGRGDAPQTAAKQWRGQTLVDRSLVRRRQLLQAGFELLGEAGCAAVTVRAVCRTAQLSLRYFYENFTDTDELIVTVFHDCNTELATALAAGPGADLADTIRTAIEAAAGYFEADTRRVRILLREPLTSELLAAQRAAVTPPLLATIAASLGMDDSLSTDGAEYAMSASALSGALVALMLDYTDRRLDVTAPQLVDYATRLVLTTMAGLSKVPLQQPRT
ncbi:TetR/AcrR family transcriptional regulator [Nocardia uniformis]|uniref:TetR/AcrR family transcriptional regulator n=1 Tax=Nocardia uniformis TaxID=53432 RepID=A0A849C389_9NOCA|nr:TetR family transcriptional regulator [Nocardia uniformis]NNH69439.1 TetR/AcrR family transcriptional regulator [Nocardia uniformis]